MFSGFQTVEIEVPGAQIHGRIGGQGAPLLLLHGFPQTHAMWHQMAAHFAQTHQVVALDLRGYGQSLCKDGDFSFRAMAADMVAVMAELGYDRFHVISHDRGSRCAHRLVLDHPRAVASVALIDILPTLDVWRSMDDWLAKRYYHWTFLAQPGGLPERLINHDPVFFLHQALSGLSGDPAIFAPEAMADYESAAQNSDVVKAWCGDYAAGATLDPERDKLDEGRQSDIPCLILWGKKGVVAHHMDPVKAWRKWFPNAQGQSIDAGHFLVEERPDETLAALTEHLTGLAV